MPHPTVCPQCNYQRQEKDQHVHAGLCPACGIAYEKWQEATDNSEEHIVEDSLSITRSKTARFLQFFTYIPEHTDPTTFWGRAFLWCCFALWGGSFIVGGVDWESVGGSFLHSINLPFHEFGHVLFSPLGRFMMILGGSLFQILMPLIAMLSFSWQMKDNFAAAIMLWWSGQNMIDVAPYIADAKYRSIPLIRGLGEESHDWGNLLRMLDMVDSASSIANASFFIGTCTIVFALYWAALLLYRQKQTLLD